MKSSLKKLRGLATHHRTDSKEKRDRHPNRTQLDELAQAFQDMQDMRSCYDSLYDAAAATANSAFEFSEALKELGTCLLEKTAQNEDEESGKVLLMLGKAQFELQKLLDRYRSHITQTITTPSESLLNELRTVEEMKRQCDEKKDVFDYMLAAQKEKGKSKNTKGETITSQQLQAAQEEYDQEATLFVFRLKSLKQGQSRSLLTQAARHHAAQLNFFRKGNKSLEAIEPHVKLVADQQHIDYQFSGLEDDGTEDDDYVYNANDDGELSFDYGHNEQGQEASTSINSMELDQTTLPVSTPETSQENLEKSQAESFFLSKEPRFGSQSAPIFPEKKFDPAEKLEMRPSSTRKFHTYVLPTPLDSKGSSLASSASVPVAWLQSDGCLAQSSHSYLLGQDKNANDSRDDLGQFQTAQMVKPQSLLNEINNSETKRVPPPLAEGLSLPRHYRHIAPDNKKIKRQAFSGPLSSKHWSSKTFFSVPQDFSSTVFVAPMLPAPKHSTSPKISPTTSPPLTSPPKIRELHELPRPPLNSVKPTRPPSLIGHSAPLVSRGPELFTTSKALPVSSHMASPLPMPPGTISRSFSIPSSSQRAVSSAVGRLSEARNSDMAEEIASPPLMPMSLMTRQSAPKASQPDVEDAK